MAASWRAIGRDWPEMSARNADSALIAALAAGDTAAEAARKAGVSERTVRRRLDDPGFKRALEAAKAEALARAVAKLSDRAVAAVDTLAALLDAESESVRLGAARSVLELGSRLREDVTVTAEL